MPSLVRIVSLRELRGDGGTKRVPGGAPDKEFRDRRKVTTIKEFWRSFGTDEVTSIRFPFRCAEDGVTSSVPDRPSVPVKVHYFDRLRVIS